MSINSLLFRAAPFALPRLLLLDAREQQAAAVSLALDAYCMAFSFRDIFRSAVCSILGEGFENPIPGGDETIELGGKTYLRRNLEANIRDALETDFGREITALLMHKRIYMEVPYFACITIEDATTANSDAVEALCKLLVPDALKAHEIYWLSISSNPMDGLASFPPWVAGSGIRIGALPPSSFTSRAEILSAMETLP